ncbi:unnamed protein product, partial [Rotaria sp. Silwood1]
QSKIKLGNTNEATSSSCTNDSIKSTITSSQTITGSTAACTLRRRPYKSIRPRHNSRPHSARQQ